VKCLPTRYSKCIIKTCLSSQNLAIETGRYNSVRDRNRLCFICSLEIEDEFQFVLKCPLYIDLRKQHIKTILLEKAFYFQACATYQYTKTKQKTKKHQKKHTKTKKPFS